jgi:hypothetical protein
LWALLAEAKSKPGKQHRRPRFSSNHNVKHPRTMAFQPAIRRIRPRLENRPRLRRGGDIDPDPIPVNRIFPAYPQGARALKIGRKYLPPDPLQVDPQSDGCGRQERRIYPSTGEVTSALFNKMREKRVSTRALLSRKIVTRP